MNNVSTKLLSLMICMELVLAPFPKTYAADAKAPAQEEATTAAFFKSVQEEAEFVFNPETGCAKVGADGNATIVNQTTSGAIHGDPEFKTSISCEAALKYLQPRWKKAMDLKEQYEKADKSDKNDKNCSDCSVAAKKLNTDFAIPEGATCSLNEQRAIAAERKAARNPKCSFENEFSFSSLVNGGCGKAFIESFWSSLTSMAKTAWHGITSAGHAIASFFTGHKEIENNTADRGLQFAGLSPAEVAQAQKDPEAAKRSWVAKVGHAMETLGTWMAENMLIDVPAYKDLWKCSKCGERGISVCKMFGVLGKDMIKYAIFDLVAGEAIELVGKTLKGPFQKTMLGKLVELSGARTVVKVASENFKTLGKATVETFDRFTERGAGKFAKDFFLKPTWEIGKSLGTIALGANKVLDDVMKAPTRIFVRGGKRTVEEIAEAQARYDANGLVDKGMGLTVDKPLKSTAELTKDPAALEVETPITKETAPKSLQDAAKVIQKTEAQAPRFAENGKALKGGTRVEVPVEEILNASPTKFETFKKSITLPGVGENGETHYFNLGGKRGRDVEEVLAYRDNNSAIVKMKDGSVWLGEQGRVLTPVAKKDIPKVSALLDLRLAQKDIDNAALKETEAQMDINGIKHESVNSTVKNGEREVKTTTGPECGNQTITLTAGRAL